MQIIRYLFLIISIFAMNGCDQNQKMIYPVSRKVDTVDVYFGIPVADPYRWLENDTSPETAEWVKKQNKVTRNHLSNIPFREKIREKLTKMWNYPRFGVPFREGDHYFYFLNNGLQSQSVLYCKKGIDGISRTLLDPNELSSDGTVALTGTSVSRDGKYMAYSLAQNGSDWNTIRIMEVETGKVLPDVLKWVKFSGMSWVGHGFYYSHYDAPKKETGLSGKNEFQKVYFHQAGTAQSEDKLIHSNPKYPQYFYGTSVTEDERFLILYESESTSGTAIYFRDLSKPEMPFKPLATGFDHEYGIVDNLGDNLLVLTNHKAPGKKLVLMDPDHPKPENWTTIIPERDDVLESVHLAGNILVTAYMQKAASKAFLYALTGKYIGEMKFPGIGTMSGFSSKKGDNMAFYGFSSFTFPLTVYRYDVKLNTSTIYHKPEIMFDPDLYEVEQVFYPARDLTVIPMFLVMKKGIERNGENPLLLYGYGGFNVSLTPNFSVSRLLFLESGGIYAVANLRGGGEFGEEWHKAGTKERKQNTFNDFIAAAEYLIANKYTSPENLAIMGGSNGGLLVGACMTQRPELFKVAIPQVGVMDMLRYHKFTIGWAWACDYGTSESRDEFNYLMGYSPLHQVKDGVEYPATLAFTADHDDRVVPAHTFKFMAALQAGQRGENPVLLRIETKAGHGAGKPTAKQIDETTDLWSFVFYHLGMTTD